MRAVFHREPTRHGARSRHWPTLVSRGPQPALRHSRAAIQRDRATLHGRFTARDMEDSAWTQVTDKIVEAWNRIGSLRGVSRELGVTHVTVARTLDRLRIERPKRAWKSLVQYNVGDANPRWRGIGKLPLWYWNRLLRNAASRNVEVIITPEYASQLFDKQQERCALSGEQITLSPMTKATASLDRIDSSLPYKEGNVHWVHKTVNAMKWAFSMDKFYELAKAVATCRA